MMQTGDNNEIKNSLANLLMKNKPKKQKTIIREDSEEEKEKIKVDIFNQEEDEESGSPNVTSTKSIPSLDNV